MLEVTKENFDSTLKATSIVVVKFGAEWCPPCKLMKPILEEFANENPSITVGDVDIDNQSDLCMKYSIRNVPTTLIFKDQVLVEKVVGLATKEVLKEKTNLG